MKLIQFATMFALISTLVACGTDAKVSVEGGGGPGPQNDPDEFQAICAVLTQSGAPIVCMDLPSPSATLESSCMTTEAAKYAAQGAVMGQYLSVSGPGVSTSCQMMTGNLTVIGNCKFNDRIVRYYSAIWTNQTASADCSAHSGQFTP